YITLRQELEIGPLHFSVMRILITVGFLRVMARRECIAGGWNILDRMMVFWAIWTVFSVAFHKPEVWITRLGVLYECMGAYFLFRVFVQGLEDIRNVFRTVCILLIPLAAM